ncbi:MAG: LiaF domain-containing protein [Halanaerobiales bacterium]
MLNNSIIWGLLLVVIGALLLANSLGMAEIDVGDIISTYWPLILILFGLKSLQEKGRNKKGSLWPGFILLLLGLALLARNIGYLDFNTAIIWRLIPPVILIFLGFNLIKGGAFSKKSSWAVMSGIEQKQSGWQLENKSYGAFMGGVELDLRNAEIPEGETVLDLTAVMGGIDIRAPENINIVLKNTSILGGAKLFQDDSGGILVNRELTYNSPEKTTKNLTIYSRCIMGGIEIKG